MTGRQQLVLSAINLGVLAAVAYFLAAGTSDLLAAELGDQLGGPNGEERRDARLRAPSRSDRQTLSIQDGDPILERNIFDSETGPIVPGETLEAFEEAAAEVQPDELPLVPCAEAGDVKVALEATVVDPSRPEWSFASVSEGRDDAFLVRVGDALDERTVRDITWRYLLLEGDRDRCYLDLFAAEEDKKKRRRRGRPSSSKRLSRRDVRKSIKKLGPHKRAIDRNVLDRALANPSRFMRGIRVRPHKRGGEIDGFKLRRVRRHSVFKKLGARPGDVVHSVNGKPLTSVESALAAYQELRSASGFEFEVTRKGKPVTLEIDVQ